MASSVLKIIRNGLKNRKNIATVLIADAMDYKSYTVQLTLEEDRPQKFQLNISTLRGIILQSCFFNDGEEVIETLEGIKLKVKKDIWE